MASPPSGGPPSNPDTPLPSPRKLKSATPMKRKRRRAPPTLSVTSVFSPARLPDSARALWSWPVTSWYVGDVTQEDANLASDRPFNQTQTFQNPQQLPPLQPHYRLRWLEQDAEAAAASHNHQVPLPDALPLFPYAKNKDSTACARQSPCLDAPDRTRRNKSDSASKKSSPPKTNTTHSFKAPSVSSDTTTMTPAISQGTPLPDAKDDFLPPPSPNVYMRPAHSSLIPTPHLSPCQQNSPSLNTQKDSHPVHLPTSLVADTPSSQQLRLQFVSPQDPKLMASIDYSLSKSAEGKDDTPMQAIVGHLQLDFRSVATEFANNFEDADITDEVGPEMLRLSSLLQCTEAADGSTSQMAAAAVNNELARQNTRDAEADEARQIMQRLKQIEQEKIAAKKVSTESRRISKRSRSRKRSNKEEDVKVEAVPQHSSASATDTTQTPVIEKVEHVEKPVVTLQPPDTSTPIKLVASPCAILPGQSNDNSDMGRMPSPVSPIQAASRGVVFVNVSKGNVAPEAPLPSPTSPGLTSKGAQIQSGNGVDVDPCGKCSMESASNR